MKYPEIEVQLSGEDGNAFAVLGKVRRALRKGGVSVEEVDEFLKEATSGDYGNLFRVCMEWVDVC